MKDAFGRKSIATKAPAFAIASVGKEDTKKGSKDAQLFNFFSFLYKMEVKDSNGNILADGDSVVIIKDLKVKGSSLNLKRGTAVKKIKLTDNEDEVDCRINGSSIVLRTEFLKKV